MEVQKTIKAKVVGLTNVKRQVLDYEYEGLQRFLRGDPSIELYSANKQQAKQFYKRIKPKREYPLSIRKDLIRVEQRDIKIARYWVRIPVKLRRGGIWVAIKPHCEITDDLEICESKLLRQNGEYFLYLTVKKEVELKRPSTLSKLAIIAVDLGECNPAASVVFARENVRARLHGGGVRGIRAHYNHLRKDIGRAKIRGGVKRIRGMRNKESRTVNCQLHRVSREIVNEAIELKNKGYEPVIVLGKLKGIRKPRVRGKIRCRKNLRKVHMMPFQKLATYITYKANWEEIWVEPIDERWTSQTCHRCGNLGKRHKRLFRCPYCGLQYNVDLNGAWNIRNKLLDQWFGSRAVSEPALNWDSDQRYPTSGGLTTQCTIPEATSFRAW